jgi:catechol-2,3-dioxygenase
VCIEFIGFGITDESGYEFCHTFSSLVEATNVIETFLEKPISDWTNHTKTDKYPEKPDKMYVEKGAELLLRDISLGRVHLPAGDLFKLKSAFRFK